MSRVHLARLSYYEDDLEQAQTYADDALTLSERLAEREGIAMSLHVSGQVALAKRRYDRAEQYLTNAREIYGSYEYEIGLIGTGVELAELHFRQGHHADAVDMLDESWRLLGQMDHAGLRQRLDRAEAEIRGDAGND